MIDSQYLYPSREFRGKPFWVWNSHLERGELLRQISILQEMGFGGVFIHSRTGLETEYLGTEWFDLVNLCADACEKRGLETWIYDEDRWPSGTAGGRVTQNPAFRMKSLHLDRPDEGDFEWEESIYAVYAATFEASDCKAYRPVLRGRPPSLQAEESLLVFKIKEMPCSPFYNNSTYLDTLNPEATKAFLESTHELYKKHCGNRLGTSIKGFFTDEPHRGSLFENFGQGVGNSIWSLPWTDKLPERYEEDWGGGFDLILPEIFFRANNDSFSIHRWRLVETLQRLFIEGFAIPYRNWCHQNHVIFTGHILHEDNLTSQVAMSGSVMRFYPYLDWPGVDVLTEGNRNYWIVKQLTSVARQYGQKWRLSELYGCTGWQMTFADHRKAGDWQAFFGINLRCHHLAWYTMRGENKRDYPGSIFYQSAWWKEYQSIETYFSRLGMLLSSGKPSCKTLVMNPVESLWGQVTPGWTHTLSAQDPAIQKLEELYQKTFFLLTEWGIDFDYGDEGLLAEIGRVGRDRSVLCVGECEYEIIVVAGCETLRSSTVALLDEFSKNGGSILWLGQPPTRVDCQKSDRVTSLALEDHIFSWDHPSLGQEIYSRIGSPLQVRDREGNNERSIFRLHRESEEQEIIMLMNVDLINSKQIDLTHSPQKSWEIWDCYSAENSIFNNPLTIPPGESRVLIHRKIMNSNDLFSKTDPQNRSLGCEFPQLSFPQTVPFRISEPNVLVFDTVRYRLNEEPFSSPLEILQVDREIRTRLKRPLRGGEMLQPWFLKEESGPPLSRVELEVSFEWGVKNSSRGALALEFALEGVLTLNGKRIEIAPEGWWVDPCFEKINLPTEFLEIGMNTLRLSFNFNEKTNLENFYLLGDFAVYLKERNLFSIQDLPSTIAWGDLCLQGFPFYGGMICYLPPRFETSEESQLVIQNRGGALLKIIEREKETAYPSNGPILHRLQPGTHSLELHQYLTRRNTFGPLHQLPCMNRKWCAPDSFITTGEEYTTEYQWIQNGLFQGDLLCSNPRKKR